MSSSSRKLSILATLLMVAWLLAGPGSMSSSASPPKKAPRHFDLLYQWGGDSKDDIDPLWSAEAELTLYSNGRIDVLDYGTVTPNCGDWYTQKSEKYITFDLDVGVVYSGTRQSDGSYFGTMKSPNGMKGVWTGHFVP